MKIGLSQKTNIEIAVSPEILREIADALEEAQRGFPEPGTSVSVASLACSELTIDFVHITEPRSH